MSKQQADAQLIADALRALEDDASVKRLPLRAKVKLSRLHRHLHEMATEYAPVLGIDVAPLSGGTPKPQ